MLTVQQHRLDSDSDDTVIRGRSCNMPLYLGVLPNIAPSFKNHPSIPKDHGRLADANTNERIMSTSLPRN
ncbi:hypothetical protein M422DRAFT_26990, partial [Sphaerobolus stellatus SS14]